MVFIPIIILILVIVFFAPIVSFLFSVLVVVSGFVVLIFKGIGSLLEKIWPFILIGILLFVLWMIATPIIGFIEDRKRKRKKINNQYEKQSKVGESSRESRRENRNSLLKKMSISTLFLFLNYY